MKAGSPSWFTKRVTTDETVKRRFGAALAHNPYRILRLECGHHVTEKPSKRKAVKRFCEQCKRDSQDSGGK